MLFDGEMCCLFSPNRNMKYLSETCCISKDRPKPLAGTSTIFDVVRMINSFFLYNNAILQLPFIHNASF